MITLTGSGLCSTLKVFGFPVMVEHKLFEIQKKKLLSTKNYGYKDNIIKTVFSILT
jgi:hypothetical protein